MKRLETFHPSVGNQYSESWEETAEEQQNFREFSKQEIERRVCPNQLDRETMDKFAVEKLAPGFTNNLSALHNSKHTKRQLTQEVQITYLGK